MTKPTTYTLLDFCNEELGCEQALDIETQHQLVIYANQLKTNFAKFGGHLWDCPANEDEHGLLNNNVCACGYEQARERRNDVPR